MTCGIYRLVFNNTDKCYVGQSLNIEKRFIDHCSLMRNNKGARKLLEAYSVEGLPRLEILRTCEEKELNSLEDIYIEKYDSANKGLNTKHTHGYRSTLCGELSPMSSCSNADIIEVFEYLKDNPELTTEDISNIVGISSNIVSQIGMGRSHKWLKDIYGQEIYNKVIYNKYKRAGELNQTSIYSNKQIEELFLFYLDNTIYTTKRLSSHFNIDESTVKAVLNGRNHKWLKTKYPEEYAAMLDQIGTKGSDCRSSFAQGKVYPPIVSPEGITYNVTNIKAFAREHDLNDTHLGRTLRGIEAQHKGWKLLKHEKNSTHT